MIDRKDIEKAMDAVDKVIFDHGKRWAIESAYNQYLAYQYKIDAMPNGLVKSVLLYGAAAALSHTLRSVSASAFRPNDNSAKKARTVYVKGIEPDSVFSGAALIDAINKELQ